MKMNQRFTWHRLANEGEWNAEETTRELDSTCNKIKEKENTKTNWIKSQADAKRVDELFEMTDTVEKKWKRRKEESRRGWQVGTKK